MSYLDSYRQNPSYSTSQWQSIVPPAPSFQPQPSWGGLDFYRAIAGQSYDGGLYNHAYGRLQGIGTQALASMGPSIIEAKLLHRRAYGGLGDIMTMAPMEIGAAAAYEVWRNWRYNFGVLAQPLGGDTLRQREALVGLAIGEASQLWQYTTRAMDNTGRFAAVEAAAITAARIFDQGNQFLTSSSGAYGMGTGMNMGALSPAVPGAMGGGMVSAAGGAFNPASIAGQGMGTAATAGGLAAPPLIRQRSISMGSAPGGYGYGSAGGVPGYAGSTAGMYGGTNGTLGVANPITRPLSSSGYGGAGGIEYGAPTEYGPGRFGETALSRFERHRAERAALKEARYRDGLSDGHYPSARAYDDNYEYEYGDGYGYGGGYGDNLYRPRHGRRRGRAARAAERGAFDAADTFGMPGDRYERGGQYRDGIW